MDPPADGPQFAGPSRPLPLRPGEVRVVSFWLDLPLAQVESLAARLSPDERQRADRFHFDQHRHRFVVGRGLLRGLLASSLGIQPGEVRFVYGPHGKPALAPDTARHAQVSFNLAHSGPAGLCALALDRDVGVDVETVRPLQDLDGIARRAFGPAEVASLESRLESDRLGWFFRIWTRKEALLKARGEGLGGGPGRFDVSQLSDRGEASRDGSPCGWFVRDLPAPEGFAAALAVRGPIAEVVVCRHFEQAGDGSGQP
jgi:4'-phosphopantetheinyl transferase